MWCRYHYAIGDFLLYGTGTGLPGTGTGFPGTGTGLPGTGTGLPGTGTGLPGTGTSMLLVIFYYRVYTPGYFGLPVPVCLVPVPVPLQMVPNTIALPSTSQQRLPSSAMIYIRSLDTNPYNKYAWNSKKLHKSKRHLFLYKMRAKYELNLLKLDINVAILCIQHTPQPTSC